LMCFFSHESLSRLGEEQVVPRQQPVCFLFRLDLLMPIPGATTPEALVSGSILAARDAVAHEAPCVLGGGGDAVPDSAAGSSDSAVGPVSPGVRQLDQGVGLADGKFSGASCNTFSSGGGPSSRAAAVARRIRARHSVLGAWRRVAGRRLELHNAVPTSQRPGFG
uniref:Uncharacterized protein n=1 Tax=Aegilops tauschii subsp. strangulata TaxID=200361 RepID=A0A453RKB6_AEGTS